MVFFFGEWRVFVSYLWRHFLFFFRLERYIEWEMHVKTEWMTLEHEKSFLGLILLWVFVNIGRLIAINIRNCSVASVYVTNELYIVILPKPFNCKFIRKVKRKKSDDLWLCEDARTISDMCVWWMKALYVSLRAPTEIAFSTIVFLSAIVSGTNFHTTTIRYANEKWLLQIHLFGRSEWWDALKWENVSSS